MFKKVDILEQTLEAHFTGWCGEQISMQRPYVTSSVEVQPGERRRQTKEATLRCLFRTLNIKK